MLRSLALLVLFVEFSMCNVRGIPVICQSLSVKFSLLVKLIRNGYIDVTLPPKFTEAFP